jgi:thioredoxin-related protein
MKKFIISIALFFTMTTSAIATELLMFSMASCGYCQAFLKEVAPTYAQSEAAKLLPLRIISMDRKNAPKWYDKAYEARKIDGIAGTPTFIVFDNGVEVARLIGYSGMQRFYEDINNFVDSNRRHLERTAGQNPIPFESDTELDYKQALIQDDKKVNRSVPKQKSPLVPFIAPDLSTPHNKSEGSHHKQEKLPNGVINSRDIMDHIYKTETEAEIAAMWLGCFGTHTHDLPDKGLIYMPCEM